MIPLTGAIPGLLLRGSPVAWRDEETPFVATGAPWVDDRDGSMWLIAAPCAGIPLGVQDDPSNFTLDLTHPLGLATALHYLSTRGHDLAWATRWPDVIAWSVVSVSRGGATIRGVLAPWSDEPDNSAAIRVRENVPKTGRAGALLWNRGGWMIDIPFNTGNGTGDAGEALADAAALAANYALLNPDGSLTLPNLPEIA